MVAAFILAAFVFPVNAQETRPLSSVQSAEVDETSLVLQESGTEAAAETSVRSGSSVWAVVRTIIALAVVAVAIYGVVFLLKKLARPPEAKSVHLKVLASQHLGSNRFVHVVAVGSKAWLVGASDGGVGLIAEIDDREAVDAMQLDDSRAAGASSASWTLDFNSFMRKLGVRNRQAVPGGSSSAEGIRKGRERLRGL